MSAAISYTLWALLGVALLGLWARSRSAGSSVARPAVVVQRLATGPVLRVAFAPDGRHLAVVNGNGTVYLLRLEDFRGSR